MDTLTWEAVSPTKAPEAAPAENGGAQENGAAAPEKAQRPEEAAAAAEAAPQPLPPCAGHAMVAWGSKLLILGGHMKVGQLARAGACVQVSSALRRTRLLQADDHAI
jgi:hypothetical protein